MVIEISRDIDRYKETVAMGLTAKQLVFSAASVTIGGGLVLGLQFFIGMTLAVYIAIPVAAPIALGGFYSYNGMGFYEYMGRKLKMMFANRTLLYSSTEGGEAIREMQAEKMAGKKKQTKKEEKNSKNFEWHVVSSYGSYRSGRTDTTLYLLMKGVFNWDYLQTVLKSLKKQVNRFIKRQSPYRKL